MELRARGEVRTRAAAAGDEPERSCIVTRAKLTPDELIRFVAGPDGVIVPDLACRLPGRGVWVQCRKDLVATAAKTNAFARSLKAKVSVPDSFEERVEALLLRRAMDALSLANKAGLVVPGFTKVDILIAKGEAIGLVHALEAADDGAGKLDRRLKSVLAELGIESEPPIVRVLTGDELSLAMGRPHVVHAALMKGGAVQNFLREAVRLQSYRTIGETGAARPSRQGSDTEQA